MAARCSAVVEQWTCHPELEGSNPTTWRSGDNAMHIIGL
jgi:hypothetical protein